LKLQIFVRDGLSDEDIAKCLAEQISVTVGNRRAILDYLLNCLCEEINRGGWKKSFNKLILASFVLVTGCTLGIARELISYSQPDGYNYHVQWLKNIVVAPGD